MDFLSSHEDMQKQQTTDHPVQTSACLLGGKPANGQLLHTAKVSNSVFPCFMAKPELLQIFGMVIVSRAKFMFVEYDESVLWSCSFVAPNLSSRILMADDIPAGIHTKQLAFTRESINERSQFMGMYPQQNQMLQLLSPGPMDASKPDTKDQLSRRVVEGGSTGDRAKMKTNSSLKLALSICALHAWPLFSKHLPFSELQ